MCSLPHVSLVADKGVHVSMAPLSLHLAQLADSDDTALVYTDENSNNRVSYSELEARSNGLARALAVRARPTGANRDGDYVIAVCMQPTHNTVMTLLATWKAGAAYVPMEPNFPQARITHILTDAEPALLIYDDTDSDEVLNTVAFMTLPFLMTTSMVKTVKTKKQWRPSKHEVLGSFICHLKSAAEIDETIQRRKTKLQELGLTLQPFIVVVGPSIKEISASVVAESGIPTVSFEELSLESSSLAADTLKGHELLAQFKPESIAIVLYTSGSTGVPKGARLSYSAIYNRLWWHYQTFPFSETEAVCVWKTTFTFVDSLYEIWGTLLHGRTLMVLSREMTRDPQKFVKILAENHVKRLVLVPTLLRSILLYLSQEPTETPLQQLKLWNCSGEILSKDLALQFFKYFGDNNGYQLANIYGSTEMGDVTYYILKESVQLEMHSTVPIGSPFDNCAIYLLDEEMIQARTSVPGEVWVASNNLATGYVGGQSPKKFLHNPLSAKPDFSRLYSMGDFGILSKGMILYAGRTDSLIKIRGHRVDMQEVDRAVAAVQGITKGYVLGYKLESENPEILAFVTVMSEAKLTSSHIENTLKNTLMHYMIPQVIIIETIPLLANGKVDRQALLKIYENTSNNDDSVITLEFDYTGVQPEEMEAARTLFETVREVLGRAARAAVSLKVGFYELGGNSLNSIYTIIRLRDKGYYIDISNFLVAANLGEILSHLSTTPVYGADEIKDPMFIAEPVGDEDQQHLIDMIVSSFYEKAVIEQFVKHEIKAEDYAQYIYAYCTAILQAGLCVVLKNGSGTPIAVAMNCDIHEKPTLEVSGGLAKIDAFYDFVEHSITNTVLPTGKGTVLYSFFMATDKSLCARDNVAAILALGHANMRLAREKNFSYIFTTNTNPLTQQLDTQVLGFQTLLDYQVNKYEDSNGERIFAKAPDNIRAIVCWKAVD